MLSQFFQIFDIENNNFLVALFDSIFEVIQNIFGREFTLIFPLFLIPIIFFFILPYFFVKFINQKEKKLKNKINIFFLDISFFVLFFSIGFAELFFWSDRIISLSNRGVNYETWLFCLRSIGFICSLFYSLLLNFKLLQKYLNKGNLGKYKKIIFAIVFILFVLFLSCFIYLPIIYGR